MGGDQVGVQGVFGFRLKFGARDYVVSFDGLWSG
jgi:hypothetical protein